MDWTFLMLLVCSSLYVSAEYIDVPPTITEMSFDDGTTGLKKLEKDSAFTQPLFETDDNSIFQRITCQASNADSITWRYQPPDSDQWNTSPPMELEPMDGPDENGVVSTELKGKGFDIDGNYQCTATYMAYQTFSPVFQLIESRIIQQPVQVFTEYAPLPIIQFQPYSLPCFQDIDAQLSPKDAGYRYLINFEWNIRVDNLNIPFPQAVESVKNKSRISVDPNTGTLQFGYILGTDAFSETSRDGERTRLQCKANFPSGRPLTVGNYANMKDITSSAEPAIQLDVASPKYVVQNGLKVAKHVCETEKRCLIVVRFVGMLTSRGRVVGKAPIGSDINIRNGYQRTRRRGGPYSGFEFLASTEAGEKRFEVQFQEINIDSQGTESIGEILFTLYIDVSIVAYPSEVDRNRFPKNRLVETGSNVQIFCRAPNSETTTFYINGSEVKKGSPSYVTSVGLTSIDINKVSRENSVAILCKLENQIGVAYRSSNLMVYDRPVITQYPPGGVYPHKPILPYTMTMNCSAKIDPKVALPVLYWKTDEVGQESKEIRKGNGNEIKSVVLTDLDKDTRVISSEIKVLITAANKNLLTGTKWWCVVESYFQDVKSSSVRTSDPIQIGRSRFWLVIALAGGALGVIVLVLAVVCIVKAKGRKRSKPKPKRIVKVVPADRFDKRSRALPTTEGI